MVDYHMFNSRENQMMSVSSDTMFLFLSIFPVFAIAMVFVTYSTETLYN